MFDQRCTELLRQAVNMPPIQLLDDKAVHPDLFSDQRVRTSVQRLQLQLHQRRHHVQSAKRQKTIEVAPDCPAIFEQVKQILQIDHESEHETAFKSAFL